MLNTFCSDLLKYMLKHILLHLIRKHVYRSQKKRHSVLGAEYLFLCFSYKPFGFNTKWCCKYTDFFFNGYSEKRLVKNRQNKCFLKENKHYFGRKIYFFQTCLDPLHKFYHVLHLLKLLDAQSIHAFIATDLMVEHCPKSKDKRGR